MPVANGSLALATRLWPLWIFLTGWVVNLAVTAQQIDTLEGRYERHLTIPHTSTMERMNEINISNATVQSDIAHTKQELRRLNNNIETLGNNLNRLLQQWPRPGDNRSGYGPN